VGGGGDAAAAADASEVVRTIHVTGPMKKKRSHMETLQPWSTINIAFLSSPRHLMCLYYLPLGKGGLGSKKGCCCGCSFFIWPCPFMPLLCHYHHHHHTFVTM